MSRLFDIFGIGSNKNFYMRDFKNAYKYRPDINPVRQPFQGYVNFIFNRDLYTRLYGDPTGNNEFRTNIGSLLQSAELPSVSFETETLNEYNKKRIINTGVVYEPVNMTVYDTVNNEWLSTLMKYFAYHYMDPRNEQGVGDRDMQPPGTNPGERSGSTALDMANTYFGNVTNFDSNLSGYNPNETAHFFERIDYVLYHKNKGVQYSLINPVLTSFKPGSINYAESTGVMDFQLAFSYEKFTVHNIANFDLTPEDADRFEDASELVGPAFAPADLPTVAIEQNLRTLGATTSGETSRDRTGQRGVEDNSPDIVGPPGAAVPTYRPGDVTTADGTDNRQFDNPFVDAIFDVIDNGVVAAINGGDIEDVVVRTAIGGVTGIVSDIFGDDES